MTYLFVIELTGFFWWKSTLGQCQDLDVLVSASMVDGELVAHVEKFVGFGRDAVDLDLVSFASLSSLGSGFVESGRHEPSIETNGFQGFFFHR